jgi:hypothetical protein
LPLINRVEDNIGGEKNKENKDSKNKAAYDYGLLRGLTLKI